MLADTLEGECRYWFGRRPGSVTRRLRLGHGGRQQWCSLVLASVNADPLGMSRTLPAPEYLFLGERPRRSCRRGVGAQVS